MEVGLDRAEGSTGLGGDLHEAELAEEPQGDDLAIGLIQPGDRAPKVGGALGADRGQSGIRAARKVDRRGRIRRIDPGDVAAALGPADRDPDRDPRQPGAEGTVAAPTGKAAERNHEGLLGRILGLMEIAEDAMAGANDGSRFAIDEDPERVTVAGQDGVDRSAFIKALMSVTGRK